MISQTIKYCFSTKTTYIVSGKRTPIGTFLGKLSKQKGTDLGQIAVQGALSAINLNSKEVDEVILGNVCSAGSGQSPARQVSLGAGIPIGVPCTTVNKVCASGMKTVCLGSQSIALGLNNIVVAGGFESMSNIPFYITDHRKGQQFGSQELVDGLAYDGLTDVYSNKAMGFCAEKTATDFQIGRELQDDFAITSYERTIAANKEGKLAREIVPVRISEKEEMTVDEEFQRYDKSKMTKLKPVFSQNGSITAANASKINDGACAIVLASEEAVKKHNLTPMARIVSFADSEVEPIDFCIAPEKAGQLALSRAGMKLNQIDFFEFNEAFSVTVLANMKLLDIGLDQVNVNGGAVALGHPIGMSGARIIVTLMNILKERKGKYGMAGICNGGGGATNIIIENLQ